MSLDFSTAAQSRIVASGNVTMGNSVSCGGWCYPLTMGQSNSGYILAQGIAAARTIIQCNGGAGTNKMQFRCNRATTGGVWDMTNALATFARWRWLGVTYDGSGVGQHPTMYIYEARTWSVLTNGAGLTRTATPSGALTADTNPFRIGNGSGLVNQWAGYLAHLFAYNRILTESEMRLVADRGPRQLPRGLVFSWTGVRFVGSLVVKDEVGAFDGTGSGTGMGLSAEHPPVRW